MKLAIKVALVLALAAALSLVFFANKPVETPSGAGTSISLLQESDETAPSNPDNGGGGGTGPIIGDPTDPGSDLPGSGGDGGSGGDNDESGLEPECKTSSDCEERECMDASCASGRCEYSESSSCDDGDDCTSGDTCKLGKCVPGEFVCECKADGDCDPGICRSVRCEKNKCIYTETSGGECDDGSNCTSDDTCVEGKCIPGEFVCECKTSPDCPSRQCKDVDCEGNKCVYIDLDGPSCDDGNDCTEEDTCEGGECIGQNACECEEDKDCVDGDPDTRDSCVKNVCVHVREGGGEEDENETSSAGEGNETLLETNWSMSMTIEAYPRKGPGELYAPGERLRSVTVTLYNSSGAQLEGAAVQGSIRGFEEKPLVFSDEGGGVYSANAGYAITYDDGAVIEIRVGASAGGKTAEGSEYLLVEGKGGLEMILEKPAPGKSAAPGQKVSFECKVAPKSPTDSVENLSVRLIDEGTGTELEMSSDGGKYSAEMPMPAGEETAYFLVLAKALVNGNRTAGAQRAALASRPVLDLKFDRGRQDVGKGSFAVEVRYVDSSGEPIGDASVSARIITYPSGKETDLILAGEGGVFTGIYKRSEGENSAEIEATDSHGNKGTAVFPPEFFEEVGSFELPWGLIGAVAVMAVIAAGALFALKTLMSRKSSKSLERKKLAERKTQLEQLIKDTKLQFYKRKITDEVANKQIREYEEELKLTREKLGG